MTYYSYNDYLIHHGIKGMKWGVRHDYVKKGRRQGVANNSSGKKKKQDAKKWIKRGAIAAGVILGGVGATYLIKSGQFSKVLKVGENISIKNSGKILNKGIIDAPKKLRRPETVQEALKKANPFKDVYEGRNNCTYSSIAGYLRTEGYDVTAKTTGGKQQIPIEIAEKCFGEIPSSRKREYYPGNKLVKQFGTREGAEKLLIDKFGTDAKGFIGIKWKGTNGGHAFNFEIHNGKVTFMDFKNGKYDHDIDASFNKIDTDGGLTLINLKGLEPKWDSAKECVQYK